MRDNPDALLSFISEMNVMTLLAAIGTAVPVAVSERCYPPMMKVSPLYSALRRLLYPAAAAVVDAEAMRVLDVLLAELPPTLAAKLTSKITGRSKADLYKMTLALKPQ